MNALYGYFVLPESLAMEHRRSFDFKRANPIASLLKFKKYPAVLGLIFSLLLIYLAAHAVQSNWGFANINKFGWTPKTKTSSILVLQKQIMLIQWHIMQFQCKHFFHFLV